MSIYVAMGANQNSYFNGKTNKPIETFLLVFEQFKQFDIHVTKVSGLWESPAWPDPDAQPAYNNAVIAVETNKQPMELLGILKDLEFSFGRREGQRNAARPLDLDILDYDGQVLNASKLTLPHPRMYDRPFVLFPLWQIAPDWHDPIKNRAVHDWIARLELAEVKPLKWLGKIS